MKAALITLSFCLLLPVLRAAEPLLKLPSLKLKNGEEYKEVEVTAKEADGIRITHSSGLRRVPMEELPKEVLEKLGGFDPATAEAAKKNREAAADKARMNALVKESSQQVELSTYGPVSEYIEKRKDNVLPEEAAKYKKAKALLEQLRATCEPLIQSGQSRADVARWSRLVWEERVDVGMPATLVILSWGKPTTISTSSSGPAQWVYERGTSEVQYVYVKQGFVSSWSD